MSDMLLVIALIAFALYGFVCSVKNIARAVFKTVHQIKAEKNINEKEVS